MLKGSETPRIYTPPKRRLTPDTSLGFDIIEFAEKVLSVELVPWQKWFLIHAFEIEGDFPDKWRFRFRVILLLVGRQNGKTTLGMVISLYFLYILGVALILGTAQDVSTAEDTWQAVVDMAQSDPDLAAEIEHVWMTNGAKRLSLTRKREYRVRASTRKAGRGRSADLVLMDEIREHTDFKAWAALSKTGMARDNSVILCLSNAGDASSVLLRHLRTRAHLQLGDPDGIDAAQGASLGEIEELEDDTLAIFEWSADPKAEITDKAAWAQANPSLGYYITERAIKSALATDTENDFRTEVLCQWITAAVSPPFPVGAWEAGKDEQSEIAETSPLYFGIDISSDRNAASIAVCGVRPDGAHHIELVANRAGIGWTINWLKQRAMKKQIVVAMQGRGAPVSSMVDVYAAIDGVEVYPCEGRDLTGYCGRFYDAVSALDPEREGPSELTPVYHRTQAALDLAANIAVSKPLGDGAWAWDRNKSLEDISPLIAATMAYGLATKNREKKKYASVYATDDSPGVFVI